MQLEMVVDINYANKGSHALQAHCQTQVHKKKVQMIASTHSGARILPASVQQASQGPETIRQQCQGKIPIPVMNRIANAEVGGVGLLVSTGSIDRVLRLLFSLFE